MKPKLLISESAIQRAILDYLQLLQNQGKILFLRLNAGKFPIQNKNGKWRMLRGAPAGWSDIIVWKPIAQEIGINATFSFLRTYFLEVKSSSGKLLGDQMAFEQQVQRLGGKYYVVRSVEEVKQILL